MQFAINPYDDELLPIERNALLSMIIQRNKYIKQGQLIASSVATTMIQIMWDELKGYASSGHYINTDIT